MGLNSGFKGLKLLFFTMNISCSFETPETIRAQRLHNPDDLNP